MSADNENDPPAFPVDANEVNEHVCDIWANLAESLEEHVLGATPKSSAEAHELIKMAAQAEACRWRTTGEHDAFDIELPRNLMSTSPIGVK